MVIKNISRILQFKHSFKRASMARYNVLTPPTHLLIVPLILVLSFKIHFELIVIWFSSRMMPSHVWFMFKEVNCIINGLLSFKASYIELGGLYVARATIVLWCEWIIFLAWDRLNQLTWCTLYASFKSSSNWKRTRRLIVLAWRFVDVINYFHL